MNYMKDSAAHLVQETRSTIIFKRVKGSRCDKFNQVVEAVLAEHPEAKTHIDSESGAYDTVVVAK
ncbi:hypothetical protein BL250_03340 [Erwinia sp. OLTSP20]|uniref:hypothetical protein n=1 Tax=unclassified Erwinia TaxID=2622719 RepID=UPI000C19552B|nr:MULTISPECIES: hypothetical protein [unclassified Erwinia]PIJ51582.1 hypothetical protein BV501_03905 [Erwinia sp. OAMSP11]PIJ68926.1 hypothetical protein BK416_15870 [Erwinia sp. OLSSP12]PIJ83492.1 hypothetical protein BLD47_04900 [Erwinia sp. OLCASP19]PIJ83585.1 hypothetical protein BLD49_13115 [Erwinia sp. OLMDSP33]PIJ86325.1 hypothetical protein BLD46_04330 [Erwinia sp. OLMTSP26]